MYLFLALFVTIGASFRTAHGTIVEPIAGPGPLCRVMADDISWPSLAVWSAFNHSVNGRLVATTPLASVCYGTKVNSTACALVQSNWNLPEFHESSSSSIMSAPYSNWSCSPFIASGVTPSCTRGSYVQYSVNISAQTDVAQTVAFATTHNLRLVVRNSGHDYMGKSTGAGGLAIWTHYLQQTTWFTYKSPAYTGPAVTAQAGVTVSQLYREASSRNLTVLGGDCPSVGYTGGFVQGGGHGPLSGLYGMAADDVLEIEVILMNGQVVTASATSYPDLFWALRGGGGGTFGIVWSVTSRAHSDMPVSGATVQFAVGGNVTLDAFWSGVSAYRAMTLKATALGGYAFAIYEAGQFQLYPLLLPGKDITIVRSLLEPWLAQLSALGIPFNATFKSFPGFLQAYENMFINADFDIQNAQLGGRLLPSNLWTNATQFARLNSAIRAIVDDGAGAYDISVSPVLRTSNNVSFNAVLPVWRTAQTTLSIFLPWNQTGTREQAKIQQEQITNVYVPSLKVLTPDSGAYLNEADGYDPDWKQDFYGVNYQRLLTIKDKYDPEQMLYGATAVGGDRWIQQGDRLCQS